MKRFVVPVAGAMALTHLTFAVADDELSETPYIQSLPVVLSASRLTQPLSEAPNSMTVIDRQMIRASGFRQIADLFRLVPGMYVGNVGANLPFVSLNGITDQFARRMQVLVDGRSVYLPPFGGVDWLALPLQIDDIERIEIVRGPAAASHGTNSFYGVINIITRDASAGDRSVKVSKGGMGISDASVHLGSTGESLDYRLSFAYRAEGGDNPDVMNDGSHNRLLNLRSNYRYDADNSVDFQFGYNDGMRGQGTAGRGEDAFRDESIKSDFQQLTWSRTWTSGDESKLMVYRTNWSYSDPYACISNQQCSDTSLPQYYVADLARSQRLDLEFQTISSLGKDNRLVWGGGVRNDYASRPLLLPSAVSLHQSRVFAHDEWRLSESALMNLGAMYEDDGVGHREFSPRLALNYHLTPDHTLRAMAASATRNPEMIELYMRTAPSTYWSNGYIPPVDGLKPERIFSREIGYVGQLGDWSLDGRIYYEKVSDIILIDAYVDGNLVTRSDSFKNLLEQTYKGLDVALKYKWETGNLTLGFAHQETQCAFSDSPTQFSNTTLIPSGVTVGQSLALEYQTTYLDLCSQSVPKNSGSLLLDQHIAETYQLGLGYYARSQVRVNDVAPNFPPESTMNRVDVRLAKTFGNKARPGGGEIAVVVQNVFQDNYTGYGNVQQRSNLLFNRRAYLTGTIHF